MGRSAISVCLILLSCCAAYGRPTDNSPSFEVASVKAVPPPDPRGMRVGCAGGPGTKDPNRWTCQNMTVNNLISMAYELKRYQMSDPAGFQAERFDVSAKLPEGTTREQFRQMQQNLLKERFKLALHFEKKEMPGYELVVAKGGPKLKEYQPPKENSEDARPPAFGPAARDKDGFPILPPRARGMIMENGKARWATPDATTEQIATMLGGQLNRPVVDATGLKGKYDVSLMWVSENMMRGPAIAGPEGGAPVAPEPEAGPTLTSAIQDQLGLKLQPKKTTVDVVVIDHVEKAPTEN